MIVAAISHDAWSLLSIQEQFVLLALDDYEIGRFDLAELERRLVGIRKAAEPREQLAALEGSP